MEVRIAARLVAVLLLFMCCTLEGELKELRSYTCKHTLCTAFRVAKVLL